MKTRVKRFALAVLSAAIGLGSCAAIAGSARAAEGRSYALLIGVENYDHLPKLDYSAKDVEQLKSTLQYRLKFLPGNIYCANDEEPHKHYRPTRAKLMEVIPEELSKAGPDDTVIVYFTGHAVRKSADAAYLAPQDFDPTRPAETGIAISWFQDQLKNCRAAKKLLVLDACHAGSSAPANSSQGEMSVDELSKTARMPGVITLCSCAADQPSQVWEEKQQSLFSYCLNKGLRGQADADGNSQLSIDELFAYVNRAMDDLYQKELVKRPQNPTIWPSSKPQLALTLQPPTVKELISDMADNLAEEIEKQRLPRIGVSLEFAHQGSRGEEKLGGVYEQFGKYCANLLEQALIERAAESKFTVVPHADMANALHKANITLKDLTNAVALKKVSDNVDSMPAIAVGSIGSLQGNRLPLECQLNRIDGMICQQVGKAKGTAELGQSDLAMFANPDEVPPPEVAGEPPQDDLSLSPSDRLRIPVRPIAAPSPMVPSPVHPLHDPKFASQFRVRFMVAGNERKLLFEKDKCYLPVRPGEVYEIFIENRTGKKVILRALVGGRNTLPEVRVMPEALENAPADLKTARYWVLDPKNTLEGWVAIRGFVEKLGAQGQLREFTVKEVNTSLAGRDTFSDQLSMITLAFYETGTTRGLGTVGGAIRPELIPVVEDPGVRELLGVANIMLVEHDRGLADAEESQVAQDKP